MGVGFELGEVLRSMNRERIPRGYGHHQSPEQHQAQCETDEVDKVAKGGARAS